MCLLTSPTYAHNSADTMAETAKRFLSSLTPEQTEKAVIPFESDERMNWHYIPKERKGLPLKDMTPPQKHLASALLNAGLSQQGYIKATTIMSLEDVLRMIEKDNGVRRNPEGYFFSIFGQPSETGTWGYRVEGHHLSLNFTLKGGKVVGSPNFLGANPAEVREGPRKGLRVLRAEEDLGRALIAALTAGTEADCHRRQRSLQGHRDRSLANRVAEGPAERTAGVQNEWQSAHTAAESPGGVRE